MDFSVGISLHPCDLPFPVARSLQIARLPCLCLGSECICDFYADRWSTEKRTEDGPVSLLLAEEEARFIEPILAYIFEVTQASSFQMALTGKMVLIHADSTVFQVEAEGNNGGLDFLRSLLVEHFPMSSHQMSDPRELVKSIREKRPRAQQEFARLIADTFAKELWPEDAGAYVDYVTSQFPYNFPLNTRNILSKTLESV